MCHRSGAFGFKSMLNPPQSAFFEADGPDQREGNMKMSRSSFAVAVWVLLVIALAALALASRAAPVTTTMKPLGSVIELSDCQSRKRSHPCTVRTTSHQWLTDLGSWPGDILQPGDALAMRTDKSAWRTVTWMCRNGVCRSH